MFLILIVEREELCVRCKKNVFREDFRVLYLFFYK